ncbi:MAG: hypothetical protein AB1405_17205, partial [Bdellovibrionota bacterium]
PPPPHAGFSKMGEIIKARSLFDNENKTISVLWEETRKAIKAPASPKLRELALSPSSANTCDY